MDMDMSLPKTPAELAECKAQLDAAVAGRLQGLTIDTPHHWGIGPVEGPALFFRNLGLILPERSTLYLEGTSICDKAAQFYAAHRATDVQLVERDTIFPVPDCYHVVNSAEAREGIIRLFEELEPHLVFSHIKGYADGNVIFVLHDGFGNVLRIREDVVEENVRALAQALGAEFRFVETKPRNMRQLELFRKMLDDPDMARKVFTHMASGETEPAEFHSKPWWIRIWKRLQ